PGRPFASMRPAWFVLRHEQIPGSPARGHGVESSNSSRVPARTFERSLYRRLGPPEGHIPARPMAPCADLRAPLGSIRRWQTPDLLCPQCALELGNERFLDGDFPRAVDQGRGVMGERRLLAGRRTLFFEHK